MPCFPPAPSIERMAASSSFSNPRPRGSSCKKLWPMRIGFGGSQNGS